jgi:hypothetical protein
MDGNPDAHAGASLSAVMRREKEEWRRLRRHGWACARRIFLMAWKKKSIRKKTVKKTVRTARRSMSPSDISAAPYLGGSLFAMNL